MMGRMKELGMEAQQAAESTDRFERGDRVKLVWIDGELDVEFISGPSGPGDIYRLYHETRGLMYINGNASTFEGIFELPNEDGENDE